MRERRACNFNVCICRKFLIWERFICIFDSYPVILCPLPSCNLVDICHSFLNEIVGLFFGFYFDIKQKSNRDCNSVVSRSDLILDGYVLVLLWSLCHTEKLLLCTATVQHLLTKCNKRWKYSTPLWPRLFPHVMSFSQKISGDINRRVGWWEVSWQGRNDPPESDNV